MERIWRLSALFLMAILATKAGAQANREPSLRHLVDAERAFAAMSVKTNIRDSFIANFADDGVVFNPGPVNAKQMYSKRTAPPNPPPITLNWEPIWADVSQAGDMGYTTGPFTVTDNAKKATVARGFFFSVWKKQPEGAWKVVLDFGIDTPPSSAKHAPLTAPSHAWGVGTNSLSDSEWEKRKQEFLNAEQQFSSASQSRGVASAYSQMLGSHARLNRNGMFPFVEQKAIDAYLKSSDSKTKWLLLGSDLSKSGDLAYVYGSYEQIGETARGHYARVWQRDPKGNWKIVIDTARGVENKK